MGVAKVGTGVTVGGVGAAGMVGTTVAAFEAAAAGALTLSGAGALAVPAALSATLLYGGYRILDND